VDLDWTSIAALAVVVLAAFVIETALGFGATLISVALGSVLLPIPLLLPVLVPLNLALSTTLAVRYRREVDVRFLFMRLLPLMALGLPIGMFVFQSADPSLLQRLFGAFLVVVSLAELWRMRRGAHEPPPLSRAFEIAMLFAGGVVHGAFATGGPMAVYVTGRVITDKGRYRATLCLLWVVLNVVLLASYAMEGRVDAASLRLSAYLAPACALGLALGEVAHHRVPVAAFRVLVFALLALAGAALAIGG
jgi:uncharacterized membrane protein YfcA